MRIKWGTGVKSIELCRELVIKNSNKMNLASVMDNFSKDLNFFLILTQECNGACPYCYQPDSFRKSAKMSRKVLDDAIEFALSSFKDNQVKFTFYGGEPTLSWDMVKYALEKYPQVRFILTTNGLFLNESKEATDFLRKHLYHLYISLSIEPLVRKLGHENFTDKTRGVMDLLTSGIGCCDVHMVFSDSSQSKWFVPLFKELYDKGVPRVRTSIVRQKPVDDRDMAIGLFKEIADYVYFNGNPTFDRSSFDHCFTSNHLYKMLGKPLRDLPPTMCGCSQVYMATDHLGDIYPCDWFANYPEFKIGSIYGGFNDNARMFYETNRSWFDDLYKECSNCPCSDDIRLCPRSMCLAENYQESGNPFKPTKLHCEVNKMQFEIDEYILNRAIKEGLIDKFNLNRPPARKEEHT